MVKKMLKAVSCLAVILMVASMLPSGALAAENGGQDYDKFMFGRMNKFAGSDMDLSTMKEKFQDKEKVQDGLNARHIRNLGMAQDRPEFESEEEKFDYFQTRLIEFLDMKIERLTNAKENIDEIENEEITVELLDSYIEQLTSLKDDVEAAESMDDLIKIKESMPEIVKDKLLNHERIHNDKMIRGQRMAQDIPEFETDEEKFDYFQTKMMESMDKRIERLECLKENPDEINNEEVTVEMIDSRIDKLEEAKESIDGAESLDDLKEIWKSIFPIPLRTCFSE